MTNTTTPAHQPRNRSSRGWLKTFTVSCVVVASPALIALGMATAAHADNGAAGHDGATHAGASAAHPSAHKVFPSEQQGHTAEVSSAFVGQNGAVVHHRHGG